MSCDNYGIIAHYQKIIKKSRNDEQKLHYCIEKLFGLPITIEHLQKTGIGKTINSLRKCNGDVGTAAKALVSKWKAMIADLDLTHDKEGHKPVEKTGRTRVRLHSSSQDADECERISNSKGNIVNPEPCGNSDNKPKNVCHDINSKPSKNLAANSGPEPKRFKSKKSNILEKGEIDSSMGASFSDALVMCSEDNNKKLKVLKRQSQEKSSLKLLSKQKKSSEQDAIISAELIPLAQEIDNTIAITKLNAMPKINDSYTPNAINRKMSNFNYKEKPNISKDDSLNIGISSKTKRTKVYSGLRTGALFNVPSLFDMCIRVLQKNVDALEYTGGVPFDVLRPVLERTSPQQLLAVEHFNPYLLDDADILWEQHVKRNFRKDTKQDGETWREMFLRCENEKEYKLSILTTNIKKAQKESALPVKKTRLAYVDHAAKPPRNIQRKQELYGTNAQHIASPAARVPSLSATSSNVLLAGDPRLKNLRNIPHSVGNNQMQHKKAPLMAKTLKFIKKRYKR